MHTIKNFICCSGLLLLLGGCGRQASILTTANTETDTVAAVDTETVYPTEQETAQSDTAQAEEKPEILAVYVCGAVLQPGVYYLPSDAIKEAAVLMAGGFCEGADATYVNLAEPVCSGERIYIPTKDETAGMSLAPVGEAGTSGGQATDHMQIKTDKININTADKNELMTLPGIGENKADAILEYRQTRGKFQSTDELMNISGIKEGVYNKIKDLIIVG